MKKQIALVLAGSAAVVAGGLRMVQDLVHRDEAHSRGAEPVPENQTAPTGPPSSAAPAPDESVKPAPAHRDLARSSKAELYRLATDLKITGRSKMGKAELISAIEEAD